MNRYTPPKARLSDVTDADDVGNDLWILKLIGEWSKRNARRVLLLSLVPMIVGLAADRLVGGRVAFYAGSIQFIGLVLYFRWAFVALLCWPYGSRLSRFTASPPVVVVRVFALIVGVSFAVFCVGFAIVRMTSYES